MAVGAALLLTGVGCSGSREAIYLPPQTMDEAARRPAFDETAEVEAAEPGGPDAASLTEGERVVVAEPLAGGPPGDEPSTTREAPATRAPSEPVDDPTLIVIGGREEEESDENPLLRASRAERLRRQEAPPAVAVITNKNLAEFAEGGNLTYASEQATSLDSQEAEEVAAALERSEEEAYWRARVRRLRLKWQRNAELIDELEGDTAELRRRFYAEDDPYVRDRRIKPEWDRTIDRLDEARNGVEQAQAELRIALEEGRRAGALPGWLRDGIELEPKPRVEKEMTELDPEEPKVVDP